VCIVAAQERAEEKIKGKIEAFWWDSAFLTKNPSKSVSKQALSSMSLPTPPSI
jgi:hypothetical protein